MSVSAHIEDSWISRADEASFNWPLTEKSVVVEVGAYKGRWSQAIYDKYQCQVHCYEPQIWAFDELRKLVDGGQRPNMYLHPFAIGTADGWLPMGEFNTDACSFLHVGVREQGLGQMMDAKTVMDTYFFSTIIDLMMMNIEGYEYPLLEYMLDNNLLDRVNRLCIQWHTFVDESGVRYRVICDLLQQAGFSMLWDYFPTLQAWGRV
jgi:FkbM family methyltransferase